MHHHGTLIVHPFRRTDSLPILERTALLLPSDAPCLGVDLAGVERRETGVCLLRQGRLAWLTSAATDADILDLCQRAGPNAVIAINAPLTPPRGRCCLEDDCPCRHDPGTRSRQVEHDLLRLRVPTLATGLINVLARRHAALSARRVAESGETYAATAPDR